MGVYEAIKDLAKLAQASDNAELLRHVVALQQEVLTFLDDRRKDAARIAELEGQLRDKRRLVFRDDAYWDEETGDGPFCSPCFDTKATPVRMHTHGDGMYVCRACDTLATTRARREKDIERARVQRERAEAQRSDWLRSRY